MKQNFIIKMQATGFQKGRAKYYFMLLCFVVTLIILMFYSSKYFLALFAPIFWLILKLKNLSAERKYIADVICKVEIVPNGLKVALNSTVANLCKCFFINYNKVQNFHIESDGRILIVFLDDKDKVSIWSFYPISTDIKFWETIFNNFILDE